MFRITIEEVVDDTDQKNCRPNYVEIYRHTVVDANVEALLQAILEHTDTVPKPVNTVQGLEYRIER